MINIENAIALAISYVENKEQGAGCELKIITEMTLTKKYGWIFFYSSVDPTIGIAGNSPFLVDHYGRIHESENHSYNFVNYEKEFDKKFG